MDPPSIFNMLSPKGREVLNEAKELLTKNPDTAPTEFFSRGARAQQPQNPQIARMATLRKESLASFNDLLIKYEDDAWNHHPDVVSAFYTDIKRAFALDVLMLIENGGNAKNLTDQSSYQCGIFFALPEGYHNGRAGAHYKVEQHEDPDFEQLDGTPLNHTATNFYRPYEWEIPNAHAVFFYDHNSDLNTCRELYNEYCNLIKSFMPDLASHDPRFANWVKPDIEIAAFKATPDRKPTL